MEQLQKQTNEKPVISTSLPPDLHQQVMELAELREWKPAQAARFLIRKGFEKLDEENAVAPREMAVAA